MSCGVLVMVTQSSGLPVVIVLTFLISCFVILMTYPYHIYRKGGRVYVIESTYSYKFHKFLVVKQF